ncbi:MAG: DUF3822 family protein [Lachnoclostridium sp.]|nr:DUF3822 family protein [Lachnoclostridium sp.]
MNNHDKILDKDLIEDTSMWTLAMQFSTTGVEVAAYSEIEDNSLIYRTLPLVIDGTTPLGAIEDAVYENPFLLREFRRTFVIVEPEASMLTPSEADTAAAARIAAETLGHDGREWTADDSGARNALIAYGFADGFRRFVRRTFGNDVTPMSHLAVLSRYFLRKVQRGKPAGMLVNLRKGAIDVIVVEGGNLLMANTFTCREAADMAYYVMACRRFTAMEPDADLYLCGDIELREPLAAMLRRFLSSVKPLIFPPAMFRVGREAMQVPFSLIVSPICE